jgi:Flp pilus assembly protein TadG
MRRILKKRLLRLGRREEGVAALEFALCLIPLLLIVGGIIDFGHCWYMESVIATASREGARYAARYTTNTGGTTRLTPNNLSPSVQKYITDNYGGLFSKDDNFTVPTPTGAGYTSTTAGLPVSVTVTAQKHWFLISSLIPGMTNPQLLSSTTVMSVE